MTRSIAMGAVALLLLAGSATAEDNGWAGEVSASLTQQSGTTNSFAGTIDAGGERTWENDVAGIRFRGVFGTTKKRGQSKEVTQNSQGIFGDWKHTIHDRLFWDSKSELSRDNIQDRELRAALNTGPGYRVWAGDDSAKSHFDLSTGIGYRYELYDGNTGVLAAGPTPPAGTAINSGDTDHFVDVVAAFEYKNLLFDDKIEFTHTGVAKMPANAPDQYVLATEIILGVPLTEAWSFRAGFFAEYIAIQPDGIRNTTTRTTAGLGYKF